MQTNKIAMLAAGLAAFTVGVPAAFSQTVQKKTTTTTDTYDETTPPTSSTTTTTTEESVVPPPAEPPREPLPSAPPPTEGPSTVVAPVVVNPPAAAPAAPIVITPPAPPPPVVVQPAPRPFLGTAIELGGGATTFANGPASSNTDVGGYWDLRAINGTRRILAVEAAYTGSLQGISSLGLSNSAKIWKHGVEGDLRVNVPVVRERHTFMAPYAFGGVGYSRYGLMSTSTETSDVNDDDDIMTLPVGAGLSVAANGLIVDARFTYRLTYYNDLFRTGNDDGANGDLNTWTLGANLGYEF